MGIVLLVAFIFLIVFVVVFSIIAIIFVVGLNKKTFARYDKEGCPYVAPYSYFESRYARRAFSFPSGNNTLRGYLYGEDHSGEHPKGLLVFCHGIWAIPEKYLAFLTGFIDRGYLVFTYCNTGCGYSEGVNLRGLPQSPMDLNAALTYIESDEQLSQYPVVLLGHSWGAFAVTAGLNYTHHKVQAVCSMSGFHKPTEVAMDTVVATVGRIGKMVYPYVTLVQYMTFGKQSNLTAVEGINKRDIPVLITHANQDEFIHYDISSIISHRKEITNPKVEYITITEEGRNGHNTFFANEQAAAYNAESEKHYQQLKAEYGSDIPEDVMKEFLDGVDFDIATQPNVELLDQIDMFYSKELVHL